MTRCRGQRLDQAREYFERLLSCANELSELSVSVAVQRLKHAVQRRMRDGRWSACSSPACFVSQQVRHAPQLLRDGGVADDGAGDEVVPATAVTAVEGAADEDFGDAAAHLPMKSVWNVLAMSMLTRSEMGIMEENKITNRNRVSTHVPPPPLSAVMTPLSSMLITNSSFALALISSSHAPVHRC